MIVRNKIGEPMATVEGLEAEGAILSNRLTRIGSIIWILGCIILTFQNMLLIPTSSAILFGFTSFIDLIAFFLLILSILFFTTSNEDFKKKGYVIILFFTCWVILTIIWRYFAGFYGSFDEKGLDRYYFLKQFGDYGYQDEYGYDYWENRPKTRYFIRISIFFALIGLTFGIGYLANFLMKQGLRKRAILGFIYFGINLVALFYLAVESLPDTMLGVALLKLIIAPLIAIPFFFSLSTIKWQKILNH